MGHVLMADSIGGFLVTRQANSVQITLEAMRDHLRYIFGRLEVIDVLDFQNEDT